MFINVDRQDLIKSINIADAIISSKHVNTILSNCLFNVSKNNIEIISTDNDIAVRTTIDAVSDSSFSFTANGKKFSSIIKELPHNELIIDVSDSLLIDIKTKSKDIKGHYTLIGISSDDYPQIPVFMDENSIEIEQSILKEMIRKVIYASSNDTIKPIFNAILIVSDSIGKISSVATDSRRLSIITRSIDYEKEIDLGDGIIIPLKTVDEVYRILESSGKCRFSIHKNQCFFKTESTEIISRIVDGQFPNYKQVVPKEHIIEFKIETKKFLDSIKRAIVFTREPANKIILSFSGDKIVIKVSTPDLGESEEEISVKSSSEETISLGINAQFLIDSLRDIDSDFINFGITGQMSPLTIIPENDSNYISVIMPIQLKSSQNE